MSSSAATSVSATPTASGGAVSSLLSSLDVRGIVQKVASWEDSSFSAKYVLGFNFAYFMYRCARVSATSLLFMLCGFTMIAFAVLTKLFGWQPDARAELLSEGHAQRMAEAVRRVVNLGYNELKAVVYWTNVQKSTVVTTACFVCLPLVNQLGVSLIAVLALNAYVLHKPLNELYKKHGEKIVQPQINLARRKLEELLKNTPRIAKTLNSITGIGAAKKI